MHCFPVRTPILKAGDDLASVLHKCADIQSGDIIIVSSKAIATVEGAAVDLKKITPLDEAVTWATQCKRNAAFCQAVLDETQRLHGKALGACPGAMVCEVQPDGMSGTIITANAGLDESNIDDDFAIGWPLDPVSSALNLRQALGGQCAVIVTDSSVKPRRLGVTAFALTVAGMDPLRSEIGKKDLFGHTLHITVEAIADQLAVTGNMLMGNAAQSMPVAIVRDHGFTLNEFAGWVPGINPAEDLFRGML